MSSAVLGVSSNGSGCTPWKIVTKYLGGDACAYAVRAAAYGSAMSVRMWKTISGILFGT